MGKRGPLAKSPDRAQGHRSHRELVVLEGGNEPPAKVPRAPKGLSRELRTAWATYWRSPMAKLARDVDRPVILRLFKLYDSYERGMAALDMALMVKGSQGQIRVNPAAEHVARLLPQILRLESELGLTPMARARLGLTIAQGELTVEELNRAASKRGESEADPRIVEVDAIEADEA